MKRRCITITLLLCLLLLTGAAVRTEWTERQSTVHQIAELARSLGLPEDNPILTECSRLWWEDEQPKELDPPVAYAEEDLCILAKDIFGEARDCPWDHQCTVGAVVLNRVHDPRFPDTVRDVVAQPMQYSTSYLSGFDGIPTECWDAARAVLTGEYTIPPEIVWQANFPQGSGIWWVSEVNTGWWYSLTYFCY